MPKPPATALLAALVLVGAWLVMLTTRPVGRALTSAVASASAAQSAADAQLPPPVDTPTAEPSTPTESVRVPTQPETPDAPMAPPAPQDDGLAELRGRFVAPSGAPAVGVALELHGWEGNSERVLKHGLPTNWADLAAVTDAEGRFALRFDPPAAFQFVLRASHSGHADVAWRWGELAKREALDVGEVTLLRAGAVRGRVVDKNGAPATGGWRVYGEALDSRSVEGRDATRVSAYADNATGEFLLEGLPPGRVELKANSRIANWIDGPSIDVRADEVLEADIVYEGPEDSRRIVVITFNRPFHGFSNPAPGSIVLRGPGVERVATQISGSSQSWSFEDLEPGAYDIEIRDPLFLPWSRSGVVTGTSVDAQLSGAGAVKLTVLDPQGASVTDYRVRLRYPKASFWPNEFEMRGVDQPAPQDGIYAGLLPAAPATPRAPPPDHDSLDGDRSEAAMAAFVHAQRNAASSPFDLIVDSTAFGTASASVADLAPGETRPVTIMLQPSTLVRGRISGVPPSQAASVSVVLADAALGFKSALDYIEGRWSASARIRAPVETHTDASGQFEFRGLAPGAYVAVARFHRDFHAQHGPFELAAGQSAQIELTAPTHGAIEGRVVAHAGDLEHAWIEARGVGFYDPINDMSLFEGAPSPRSSLDAQGRFRIGPLVAARYELVLHHANGPLEGKRREWSSRFGSALPLGTVTLKSNRTENVEYDLSQQRRGAIVCRATVDGQPAVGWRLRAEAHSKDGGRRLHAVAEADGHGVARFDLLEPAVWRVVLEDKESLWSVWGAAQHEVAAGGEVELRLDVVRHSARIRVVELSTGQPLVRQVVHWKCADGSAKFRTDSNGELELRLPAGSYTASRTASRNASKATVEWTAAGPIPAEIKL